MGRAEGGIGSEGRHGLDKNEGSAEALEDTVSGLKITDRTCGSVVD